MRIGRKGKSQAGEPDSSAPAIPVVAEVTRTWQRNVARYGRFEEPFAVMLIVLEEVEQPNRSVALDDDTLLSCLRAAVRLEDDVYSLGGGSFLAFFCNVNFPAGELVAFRLATAVSATPLVTTAEERVFVTFAYGLAEWDESIGTLANLLASAHRDLTNRGRMYKSKLRPAG